MIVPHVIEQADAVRGRTTFTAVFKDRIAFSAKAWTSIQISVAQLLFLESDDPKKDIHLYINSPGGYVSQGWRSTTPCSTSSATSPPCIGLAASMGALLAGGRRETVLLPNSRIMIHQPLGGIHRQATEVRSTPARLEAPRPPERHHGRAYWQPKEKIAADTERDYSLRDRRDEVRYIDRVIETQ